MTGLPGTSTRWNGSTWSLCLNTTCAASALLRKKTSAPFLCSTRRRNSKSQRFKNSSLRPSTRSTPAARTTFTRCIPSLGPEPSGPFCRRWTGPTTSKKRRSTPCGAPSSSRTSPAARASTRVSTPPSTRSSPRPRRTTGPTSATPPSTPATPTSPNSSSPAATSTTAGATPASSSSPAPPSTNMHKASNSAAPAPALSLTTT
mmetsp:Transcript_5649/g.17882  ORF Transcript_5649/g.17882 Transcript_5649/m.17882 type:complete len:203 (+) Transcript_5649:697-1305(+)